MNTIRTTPAARAAQAAARHATLMHQRAEHARQAAQQAGVLLAWAALAFATVLAFVLIVL